MVSWTLIPGQLAGRQFPGLGHSLFNSRSFSTSVRIIQIYMGIATATCVFLLLMLLAIGA